MNYSSTAEQFWERFANLLREDLLTLGPAWGETYKPSRPWTRHMVTGSGAFLIRLGNSLGFECRREEKRIDVCYYGKDGNCYVAIEHEGGPYDFPEGDRQKGWKHEFSLLVRKSVPLRVLIIYDKKSRSAVEENLALAISECCSPDLFVANNEALLVIVGPYFQSYLKGTGITDYVAYKFADGQFVALPSLRVLPER